MELEQILSELENNTGEFPRLALKRAIEEREAITPNRASASQNLLTKGFVRSEYRSNGLVYDNKS
jgi:hypothetical protein